MRALIIAFAVGLAFAASAQAAPLTPNPASIELGAAPPIGDLIVWDWRLPHSNSKNLSTRPRVAFYVAMYPNTNIALRDAAIESWRSGRCVPWWRNRWGYDRIEPWPPARLSDLGRRLIGLDAW